MGKYIVHSGQNIFDVALHIYGSIEGIVDLMMSNTGLSVCDVLIPGTELKYTDGFLINPNTVSHMRMNNITPANGERHVYFKEPQYPLIFSVQIPNSHTSAEIGLCGEGELEIDWGDNTNIESIKLGEKKKYYHHSFDNAIAKERKIRFYGSVSLYSIDFERILNIAIIRLFTHLHIEGLIISKSRLNIDFLMLCEDLTELKLQSISVHTLSPLLALKKLKMLDLSNIQTTRLVLDKYLNGLVQQHYQRRDCSVILTMEPSGVYQEPQRGEDAQYIITSGMEAIWVILHEPAWNEGGKWKFVINDKIYTTDT